MWEGAPPGSTLCSVLGLQGLWPRLQWQCLCTRPYLAQSRLPSPPGSHDKGLHRKKAAEEVRVSASSARDSEGTLRLETDPPQLLAPLLLVSHRPCPALLGPHGLQPARLLCPWGFPGKSTRVGCRVHLQGHPACKQCCWDVNPGLQTQRPCFLPCCLAAVTGLISRGDLRVVVSWMEEGAERKGALGAGCREVCWEQVEHLTTQA